MHVQCVTNKHFLDVIKGGEWVYKWKGEAISRAKRQTACDHDQKYTHCSVETRADVATTLPNKAELLSNNHRDGDNVYNLLRRLGLFACQWGNGTPSSHSSLRNFSSLRSGDKTLSPSPALIHSSPTFLFTSLSLVLKSTFWFITIVSH